MADPVSSDRWTIEELEAFLRRPYVRRISEKHGFSAPLSAGFTIQLMAIAFAAGLPASIYDDEEFLDWCASFVSKIYSDVPIDEIRVLSECAHRIWFTIFHKSQSFAVWKGPDNDNA